MKTMTSTQNHSSAPHYIAGKWVTSTGPKITSLNPGTGEMVWSGNAANADTVNDAVASARKQLCSWSSLSIAERAEHLRAFSQLVEARAGELAESISRDAGKPRWEAKTEVQAVIGKCDFTISAYEKRCATFAGGGATTHFRPHGVVAVLGPFNFPAHLPNGHIMPALLAGNTIIFKPSDKTPLVAETTVRLWEESGLPAGVLNLVQGGTETAQALARHAGLDGLFFTGSSKVGVALNESFSKTPGKILALEMGGNNPLIIHKPSDITAAAVLVVQSAFLSSGQRCNCARRLLLTADVAADFLPRLVSIASRLLPGIYTDEPEPFCGPLISHEAATNFLQKQELLRKAGAIPLLEGRLLKPGTGLVSPALWDITGLPDQGDEETFGPLLQIRRVPTLDAAIAEANQTAYGLAAGIITSKREDYEIFSRQIHSGIINWNQPLTAASSGAPFGGTGLSGNHRPSAFLAVDYCTRPVAAIECESLALPATLPPGLLIP